MSSVVYRPDHPDANEFGMVDRDLAGSKIIKFGDAPNVISDNLGTHLRHMGTGKMLDSKSAFRNEDRASGNVCVGNDSSIQPKPRKFIEPIRPAHDIKRAIYELKNR